MPKSYPLTRMIVAIIQARVGSLRLPVKVLKEVAGKPILWHVIERAKKCLKVDQVIVATTLLKEDHPIQEISEKCQVRCFLGDKDNVLDRYYQAAKECHAQVVVRLTADCPLIDPDTVDKMITLLQKYQADYVCHDPGLPSCETGAEVITWNALEKLHQIVKEERQKEHVTLYLREHPDRFKTALLKPNPVFQRCDLRLTVDHPSDLKLIQEIYHHLYRKGEIVDLKKVIELFDKHPELKEINADAKPSEVNEYVLSEEIKNRLSKPHSPSHKGTIIDSEEGIDILACETCGFKHIIPLPTVEFLEKLYKEQYFSQEKPLYLRQGEEDAAWWELTYREYYHLLSTHLCSDEGKKKILEIGSGPGFFLKCGKALGWDVLGIEPSQEAAEYSKQFGVKVIHAFFTHEIAMKVGRFDALFMDMVLEHVRDPIALLQLTKKTLKKGGLLLINSPNDYNPLQEILRHTLDFNPWWVVPRHHLNYFDFASMQALLKKLDFEILEVRASFPMEFFLLAGENYIENPQLGRKLHAARKQFETRLYQGNPELIRELYRSFANQKIGRSFLILARN